MYPDYKYSPRKPGEKKKRQSRKAVKAVQGTKAAQAIQAPQAPQATQASIDGSLMPEPTSPFGVGSYTETAYDTFMNNVRNTLVGESFSPFGGFNETDAIFSSLPDDELIRALEITRQDLMDEELNEFSLQGTYDFDTIGDEFVKFRQGADPSSTLPNMAMAELM